MMDVPEPTRCYFCRMIRRISYRNEHHLYHRKCDFSGKNIISAFSPDKTFPVYDIDVWWSDKWDPLSFGREFDFGKPFFDQFFELRGQVPRLALQQQKPMVNSDYCHCASRNRNCYLVFSSNRCEDCYHGTWINESKNCVDNLNLLKCELCYECVGCRECYNSMFCLDSVNCRDSFFLRNCMGCSNCFGCSNLHQKSYMLFNEQKPKDEFEEFIAEFNTKSFAAVRSMLEKMGAKLSGITVKENHAVNAHGCFGDYLRNCKNAYYCFECDDAEDIRYCMCIETANNCADYSYWGRNAERIYECQACGNDVFNLRFCNICWDGCRDLTYCDHCFSSENCFGCIGLKKNKYCILNKQYSKDEYSELAARIIEHMKKHNEFGEFFPMNKSNFAYNESLAIEHMPLSREQAGKLGLSWKDDIDEKPKVEKIIPAELLPDSIDDIPDDILNWAIECEATKRPFRIVKQELEFYRRMKLPIPHFHPDERHRRRMALRNPRRLWKRPCMKCGKEMETTYAPDRQEIVYCERCYLAEVY